MNKKKLTLLVVLILLIGFVSFNTINRKSNNKIENKSYKTYLENDSGDYILQDDLDFPTDGYTLNTDKSTCTNNGEVSQNDDKTINLSVSKGTKCKLYFSKSKVFKDILLANNGGKKAIEAKATPDLTQSAVSQSYYDKLPDTCDGTTSWCEAKDRAVVENGLYAKADDYGTSYYFRGGDLNNNVIFGKNKDGNSICWKIVRINGNGTIRIIYNGISTDGKTCTTQTGDKTQIGTSQFSTTRDDNADVGYMYGSREATTYEDTVKNTNNSTIKTYIDNWYKTNIVDTGYSKYISDDAVFCNDRQVSKSYTPNTTYTQLGYGKEHTLYDAYSRRWERYHNANTDTDKANLYNDMTLICGQDNDKFSTTASTIGNKTLTYPVGLITMDETVLAGAGTKQEKGDTPVNDSSGNATSYIYGYRRANKNFYLYTGKDYWTLSPTNLWSAGITDVFYVGWVGFSYNAWTDREIGVRPVVNLSSNISVNNGTGATDSPYIVETE